MVDRFIKFLIVSVLVCYSIPALSQENSDTINFGRTFIDSVLVTNNLPDSKVKTPLIKLSPDQAIRFLQEWYQPGKWNNTENPLRKALGQLIFEASYPAFDTSENFLKKYPFDSINIPWDKFYIWEPYRYQVPVTFPINPVEIDTLAAADSISTEFPADSLGHLELRLPRTGALGPVLKDTTVLIIIDTLNNVSSLNPGFPFKSYDYPFQSDSIKIAVQSLLQYIEEKDSSVINITGIGGVSTPVWLNSKSDLMMRYWLKNEMEDSVTVWVGAPSRNTLSLYLERGVNFRKPVRQNDVFDARINVQSQDKSTLLGIQKIVTKLEYWKYRTESSFVFSQTALSNWVKGGDNSVSLATDITGYANYNNPEFKLSSNNFARLKYGYIATGNPLDIKKNLDLLETNSKLNHKAFGKFDFSGIMLFKTQIGKGYNYTKIGERDTAILVSKFMNPGILTIGFGLDYKPNKNTSINFSPFSYKGTFVPDTARIDQTKYGIDQDKRSKNEPGASFMIMNESRPFKNVMVTNRVQLFTNYINNPQNIDIDWEMIVVANLNWFTDVRFNTHLIFDDDTKTVVLDKDKNPLNGLDGKPRRTSRIQFKEMLGFSLVFRF